MDEQNRNIAWELHWESNIPSFEEIMCHWGAHDSDAQKANPRRGLRYWNSMIRDTGNWKK